LIGPFFNTYQGLRQGDPLSPNLFDLLVDVLAKMIDRAQARGLVSGLAYNLINKCVAILQHAYDTILCFENDLERLEI
jgi:hypothetical protein